MATGALINKNLKFAGQIKSFCGPCLAVSCACVKDIGTQSVEKRTEEKKEYSKVR
jgi:hypothetical protein